MRPQTVQAGALALAQEARLDAVTAAAVRTLAAEDDVALARLWLAGPGDICGSCSMRNECPDQTRCLHLVASTGKPRRRGDDWSGLGGAFRRVPLGVGKVGKVGASGTAMLLHDMSDRSSWIVLPEWAGREGIRSVAAQPLVAGDEVTGVLAVFRRSRLDAPGFQWLRVFADHLAAAVGRARRFEHLERRRTVAERENACLRADLRRAAGADAPPGRSPGWQTVLAQVELIAPTGAPVLIQGEAGTGKELVARLIHERGARAAAPFIRFDPAEPGGIAAAEQGTLFLGELSAVPLDLQERLLRRLDVVRLVAATDRDLAREVAAGRVHPALRQRLGVFTIALPPLRERHADLAPLVEHFARRAAHRFGRPEPKLASRELRVLERYPWPGNVRELSTVVERAVLAGRWDVEPLAAGARAAGGASDEAVLSAAAWRRRERANLEAALRQSGGRIYGAGGAAEVLGVPPTTLASRLKALGVASGGRRRGAPS
jgi:transcriptional regulator with GAF, ATPase, and Fis domain